MIKQGRKVYVITRHLSVRTAVLFDAKGGELQVRYTPLKLPAFNGRPARGRPMARVQRADCFETREEAVREARRRHGGALPWDEPGISRTERRKRLAAARKGNQGLRTRQAEAKAKRQAEAARFRAAQTHETQTARRIWEAHRRVSLYWTDWEHTSQDNRVMCRGMVPQADEWIAWLDQLDQLARELWESRRAQAGPSDPLYPLDPWETAPSRWTHFMVLEARAMLPEPPQARARIARAA